ncbi:MAG: glycosidase, partial [Candidatus Neomarinimicrobiota bacterium]
MEKPDREEFISRLNILLVEQEALLTRTNQILSSRNGIIWRYQYPVLTADQIPINWRFDLDYTTNPLLLERLGI